MKANLYLFPTSKMTTNKTITNIPQIICYLSYFSSPPAKKKELMKEKLKLNTLLYDSLKFLTNIL